MYLGICAYICVCVKYKNNSEEKKSWILKKGRYMVELERRYLNREMKNYTLKEIIKSTL